jgi:hypothetical protein
MHTSYNPHNANLSMTLSNDSVAVNRRVSTYPSVTDREELAYSNTNLYKNHNTSSSNSFTVPEPSNPYITNDLVYIKIDNNIFNLGLKINVIEYYVLLTYLVVSNPSLILTINSIIRLFDTTLNYKISKNTVTKYNKDLIQVGVLTIQAQNRLLIIGISNEENKGADIRSVLHQTNCYITPRRNFTKFYPVLWDRMKSNPLLLNPDGVIAKGNYILEHYFASKNFSYIENQYTTYKYMFRLNKITNDLGISRRTYYGKLTGLVTSGVLVVKGLVSGHSSEVTFSNSSSSSASSSSQHLLPPVGSLFLREDDLGLGKGSYFDKSFTIKPVTYLNTLRIQVINYLDPILRDLRLRSYNRKYIRSQVLAANREQRNLNKLRIQSKSKFYHIGVLGEYMKKYKVNYSKFMNDIDPDDALTIIEQLEYNYQKRGKTINARLISKALRGDWGL